MSYCKDLGRELFEKEMYTARRIAEEFGRKVGVEPKYLEQVVVFKKKLEETLNSTVFRHGELISFNPQLKVKMTTPPCDKGSMRFSKSRCLEFFEKVRKIDEELDGKCISAELRKVTRNSHFYVTGRKDVREEEKDIYEFIVKIYSESKSVSMREILELLPLFGPFKRSSIEISGFDEVNSNNNELLERLGYLEKEKKIFRPLKSITVYVPRIVETKDGKRIIKLSGPNANSTPYVCCGDRFVKFDEDGRVMLILHEYIHFVEQADLLKALEYFNIDPRHLSKSIYLARSLIEEFLKTKNVSLLEVKKDEKYLVIDNRKNKEMGELTFDRCLLGLPTSATKVLYRIEYKGRTREYFSGAFNEITTELFTILASEEVGLNTNILKEIREKELQYSYGKKNIGRFLTIIMYLTAHKLVEEIWKDPQRSRY